MYRFSSLVKQNKKGKNYAVFCFAGFFFLKKIYEVIVKQKLMNAPEAPEASNPRCTSASTVGVLGCVAICSPWYRVPCSVRTHRAPAVLVRPNLTFFRRGVKILCT